MVFMPQQHTFLLVPECLLIEPTETECKEVDSIVFMEAMKKIREEATQSSNNLKEAPFL